MLKRIANAARFRFKRIVTAGPRKRLGTLVGDLDQRGFVLVANNCLAGQLYEFAGIRKLSPTAGLFFQGDAYGDFLEAVASGNTSRWFPLSIVQLEFDEDKACPVMRLGPQSALFFLHYPDATEAVEKWNRRFERMQDKQIIVLASLRDGFDRAMLKKVRERFRLVHSVEPEPTPPADEAVLDRGILERMADYFERVLAEQA